MRKREHTFITNAASLLLCGVLGGIVIAASAFPAVALGGLGAKAAADAFSNLPSSIDVPSPPQISRLYANDGKTLIAAFYDENRHDIPLAEIPQVMRDAIIAAEDNRFYAHNGVDVKGVLRAFVKDQGSTNEDSSQGASTLTMQYVRQALTYGATSPQEVLDATAKTPDRKIREIRIALSLEQRLTKDQILQNYLNIAAFGQGAYGVYAASEVYFGKEPKDLTLAEAALLAGLPQAPSTYNPATADGAPKAMERRSYVLNQMVKLGMISREQADVADQEPLKITGTRTPRDCTETSSPDYGFFCDYFERWWADQPQFGQDSAERIDKLKSGGYQITSSLDVGAQASANRNVEEQLSTSASHSDALMLTAIEPGTGYVRAMKVNRTFSSDDSQNPLSSDPAKAALGIKGTYPNTTNPLLSGGGDISGYKGGSTFKLFTMLAALEQGIALDYTINVQNPYQSQYIVGSGSKAACADHRHWCPKNSSSGEVGTYNMWTGYGSSVNTYFVPLEEAAGADKAVAMAKRLGVHFRNAVDQQYTSPSLSSSFGPFTLGVTDVVPLELADAYATVAADGLYCEPMPLVALSDFQGNDFSDVAKPRCDQAISTDVAHAAADAARCPVGMGGGTGHCHGRTASFDSPGIVGHPVIGKTGTSDNQWTKTYILSTKQLTVTAMVANPDRAETPHANTAAWEAQNAVNYTLRDYMQGKPSLDWDRPPANLINGPKATVPDVTCLPQDVAKKTIEAAGFKTIIQQGMVVSPCPAGTVAATNPTGKTSKGTNVALIISAGSSAPLPPPPSPPAGP
jgi:membrane peptidoglycan carboxypeptidase